MNSLTTKDHNFFLGRMYFTSNDGSQNMFVYQPTLDTLELKKEKGTDYFLSWKSNGIYISKFKPFHNALLHRIKLFGYRMGIEFDKDSLAVEQKQNFKCLYCLWFRCFPRNPTNNFKFKNCLFEATCVVINGDKEKYAYTSSGIAFDSAGFWSFDNETARNVMIFGVDNNSSSHVDSRKNNFLVLGEGPTFGINESFGSPEKRFTINFSKANTKFCVSLHYNADNSHLFDNGKEILLALEAYLMDLMLLNLEKNL